MIALVSWAGGIGSAEGSRRRTPLIPGGHLRYRRPAAKEKVPMSARKSTGKAKANTKPAARRGMRSMSAVASKSQPKAGVRAKAAARAAKPVKLLSGGNPQIAKAEGDAPVQAYIAAMPGWKREIGRRLDAIVTRAVPNVRKAVKWNSPFYGSESGGWFLSFHAFTHYIKVTFFQGTSLRPV